MKKTLILILSLITLTLVFVSCGSGKAAEETTRRKVVIEEATAATTETNDPNATQTTHPEQPIPSPDDVAKVEIFKAPEGEPRQIVKDYFLKMANCEWTPAETFAVKWKKQGDFNVNLVYNAGQKYKGLVYSNTACDFFCFDQFVKDGKFSFPSTISTSEETGVYYFEEVVGNHCSASMVMSIQQIINFPMYGSLKANDRRYNMIQMVGDIKVPDTEKNNYKTDYISADVWECNDQSVIYDAYSKVQTSDILYKAIDGSGHTRFVDHVELKKNATGQINYAKSLVYTNEQTNAFDTNLEAGADYKTTWWIGTHSYTFQNLYEEYFCPYTLAIYSSGEKIRDAFISLDVANTPETISKELKGNVQSNFPINFVLMTIKDSSGKVVSQELAYNLSVKAYSAVYTESLRTHHYKLIENAGLKEGQNYSYSCVAGIARGSVELENFEFTYSK